MNVKKTIIERVVITGSYTESTKALDYCIKHGYHVVQSGPRKISRHRYDPSRFRYVAEREKGVEI